METEKLQLLAKQCGKNDRKAQYELYQYCYPILMSVCYRYYKNNEDSRSALNLTFLKVLSHFEKKGEAIVNFDAWIRRLMINTIIDEHRKNNNYKSVIQLSHFEKEYEDGMEGVDWNEAEDNLNVEELLTLIHELPVAESEVFNLYAIDGYKHLEIANMLKIPVGTSKWLLSQARLKLKTQVELLMSDKIVLK
ncbi:MAG: sigma-70 family RNA polymerase sigma factor [Bacteroidia bacterium]|nr:sigma-70 family RNA polymerase sigma factor [Bacteroidia bacterium]NNC84797.1 sigma-70 family RNA polymerase sigma factor [Bacteroidia bacterium]NNM16599.1 sigma-70 family RNA polymerase sigma factor [Bacteroidia bacterium]